MDHKIETFIQAILPNLNNQIIHIDPILGHGSVNQIFIITTNKEKLVVRLNTDRGFDEYKKEEWCIEKATEKGIPGPSTIKIGEKDEYSYMIGSFLEGIVGTQSKIDKIVLWKTIGRYAKLIHSIPVSGFGLSSSELMDATTNTSQEKLEKYIHYNIDSLVPDDELIRLGALTPESSKRVKQRFSSLLGRHYTFGLNHGDLSLKNVIVSSDSTVHLFDWGSAEAQIVPHHDFGEILKSSLKSNSLEFKAFLQGYGMSERDYEHIEDDVYTFMLLRAIDKLRWAIGTNRSDIASFVKTVQVLFDLQIW